MRGTDKRLIVIVAGTVILVAVLFILTRLHSKAPEYQADDTPQGVVYNYVLAMQLKDYGRAYSYLSSTLPGYPTGGQFAIDAERSNANIYHPPYEAIWHADDVSPIIESVEIDGDMAQVLVRMTPTGRGDLFDRGQGSYAFYVSLERQDGAWKISYSESYWFDCWHSPVGFACH